jgi:YfiR/HmsC-like
MPQRNSKRWVGPKFTRAIHFALPFITLLALAGPLGAAAENAEAKIKVAFLFNFAKFVSWPEPEFSALPSITICVSGESSLDEALNSLKGKSAQGRDVVVKRDVKFNQLASCQVVYICTSDAARMAKILTETGKGVLTVSDIPAFVDAGGVIGLTVSDNKVAFEVNLDAAQQADLKISAQLLKVARGVRGKPKL